MPGPADFWSNSTFAQMYIANNPNSVFAKYMTPGGSAGNNATVNNATAGVMPAYIPSQVGNNAPITGNTAPTLGGITNNNAPASSSLGGNNALGIIPTGIPTGVGVNSMSMPRDTTPTNSNANNALVSMMTNRGVTSFAAGGMVTNTGGAIRPGAPMPNPAIPEGEPQLGADSPTPMSGGQIDQEAKQMAQQNPQVMQHVMQLVVAAIQQGIITPDKLNMMVQLAKAAIANPNAYSQIRQFAIKNGLGNEQDIPQQYDPGLLYVLVTIGNAMQNGGAQTINGMGPGNPGQQNTTGQPKAGLLPEYSEGGMTGSKKHLAMVHGNEYVVPADVVLYHGKKHMDKLVEQARTPKDGTSPQ